MEESEESIGVVIKFAYGFIMVAAKSCILMMSMAVHSHITRHHGKVHDNCIRFERRWTCICSFFVTLSRCTAEKAFQHQRYWVSIAKSFPQNSCVEPGRPHMVWGCDTRVFQIVVNTWMHCGLPDKNIGSCGGPSCCYWAGLSAIDLTSNYSTVSTSTFAVFTWV